MLDLKIVVFNIIMQSNWIIVYTVHSKHTNTYTVYVYTVYMYIYELWTRFSFSKMVIHSNVCKRTLYITHRSYIYSQKDIQFFEIHHRNLPEKLNWMLQKKQKKPLNISSKNKTKINIVHRWCTMYDDQINNSIPFPLCKHVFECDGEKNMEDVFKRWFLSILYIGHSLDTWHSTKFIKWNCCLPFEHSKIHSEHSHYK